MKEICKNCVHNSLRRKSRPLTPEKLMSILDRTEGGKRAKETYKKLTGLNPPPEKDEVVIEEGAQE